MRRLLIMGAGGCGCEVLQWAKDINAIEKKWDAFAFLDFDTEMLDGKNSDAKIIGNDDNYEIREDDDFICAVGSGSLRKKIIEHMKWIQHRIICFLGQKMRKNAYHQQKGN